MTTAQTVLTQGAATVKVATIVPWILGGLILIVGLFILTKK
jgi:hypothetical protein